MSVRFTTSATTLLATAAVVTATLQIPVAGAVSTATPAGRAAQFILNDYKANPDSWSNGNGIDATFALAAAGATKAEAQPLINKISEGIAEYASVGGNTVPDAAALGKSLAFANLVGADPRNIDGVNLEAELANLRQADGSYRSGGYNPVAGSFELSWILIGLQGTAGHSQSELAQSAEYLKNQRCADGKWGGAPKEEGQPCAFSDIDSSAISVQALAAVGEADYAKTTAAEFVKDMQPNGSYLGWAPVGPAPQSTTSTATAAMMFAAVGDQANLSKTQSFIKSNQYSASQPNGLAGAIADTAEIRDTVTTPNAGTRLATAQATIPLAGDTYATAEFASGTNPTNPAPTPTGSSDIITFITDLFGSWFAGASAFIPQLLAMLPRA